MLAIRKLELGKPDAGKPPVRFDEGREADGHWLRPLNPSLPAYSTQDADGGSSLKEWRGAYGSNMPGRSITSWRGGIADRRFLETTRIDTGLCKP